MLSNAQQTVALVLVDLHVPLVKLWHPVVAGGGEQAPALQGDGIAQLCFASRWDEAQPWREQGAAERDRSGGGGSRGLTDGARHRDSC